VAEQREVEVRLNIVPGNAAGVQQQAAQLERALTEAQQRAMRTPMIPRGAVQVQQSMGAQAMALAQAAPLGQVGQLAGGLAGAAAGSIPGAAAMVGAVLGTGMALGGVIQNILDSFRPYPVTIQEIHGRFQNALATLTSTRATGVTTAEQIIRGMGTAAPQRLQRLQAAQNAGNYAEQQRLLREEQAESGAEAERLGAMNPEAARVQLEAGLRRERERDRQPGAAGQNAIMFMREREALNAQYRRFTGSDINTGGTAVRDLTDEQITQMGQNVSARFVAARARQSAAGAALGPGGIPSLRAGAPGIEDLPAFSSRQGNVLDLHSQIQQEAVRDQRQQTQFQAQVTLGNDILRELRRIGNPNFSPPLVGP
jgi:hypothetical protein